MREVVKGAAVILVEAGLATLGARPAILIGAGLFMLGALYSPGVVSWIRHKGARGRSVTAPTRSEWRELEDRFTRVDGEAEAIWSHYLATGLVKWSVYEQPDRGTPRTVQRFLSEAKTAGLALARMRDAPSKFPVNDSTEPVDRWLNAVAATVDPGTGMRGSGRDEDGDHETGFVHRLVDASKVACARLAAESDESASGETSAA